MARNYTNADCKLHGTKYCSLLNMESCDSCTVATSSQEQADALAKSLDVTISLMPEEGVSALFETDECMLCKGERGKRECYADVDIGNVEPKTETRNVIGMKSIARTGSMVPLQISCCGDCRRRLLMIEYLPSVLTIVAAAVALLLMSIRSIRESLMTVHEILPVGIFVLIVLAAVFAGSILKKNLIAKAQDKTHLRVFDIPLMSGMRERGWFEIGDSKSGITRYVFAKKRIRQGFYTGESVKTSENNGVCQ